MLSLTIGAASLNPSTRRFITRYCRRLSSALPLLIIVVCSDGFEIENRLAVPWAGGQGESAGAGSVRCFCGLSS